MKYLIVLAILSQGCYTPETEYPSEEFQYEYTLNFDSEMLISSTCPDVMVKCGSELTYECAGMQAEVYSLPSSKYQPNRPFGTATCVEVN